MSIFKNSDKDKLISSKEIYLVGRGPTTKYVNFKKKNVCYIGYRLKIKNHIYIDKNNLNTSKYKLKVGSINFGLYTILKELDIIIKSKKKIFLFGFDFRKYSVDDDYTKKIIYKPILQQITDVGTQSYVFEIIKNKFSNLQIYRCGFDFYSDINPKNLSKTTNFNKSKLIIVGEVTTNHQGDTNRLDALINGAYNAGCKSIKFSKREVETFYPKSSLNKKFVTPISRNFYEYRKKLELTNEQLDLIKYYKSKYDLEIIFSALDFKSYKELKSKGFNYFKIPSTISTHKKFINYMSKENLNKLIVSTGMSDKKFVYYILNKFKHLKQLYLLHAISSYPTSYDFININIVNFYKTLSKKYKNIIPGYSSHEPGSLGCIMAVVAGAKMIEKHIKIGESDWMHYDDAALDVNYEFPSFVNDIHRSFFSLGSIEKKVLDIEHHKYDFQKKKK